MKFKTVDLGDRDWIVPLVRESGEIACEYCFGNIYMWGDGVYHTSIARNGSFLVSLGRNGRPYFLFPVGTGNDAEFCGIIEEMSAYMRNEGAVLEIRRASSAGKERLERLFPGRFDFFLDRENSDYVYERERLAELSGKKYHGKRNHISAFAKANPDWHFERISPERLGDCHEINRQWYAEHLAADETAKYERIAVNRGLGRFFESGFSGGIVYAAGRAVAYSFGEHINGECFITHVEKALSGFREAYSVINRCMALMLPDVKLINREEDMGREGLRTAKLSYHPAFLHDKFILRERVEPR